MVDVLCWIFGLPPAPWWLPLISFPSVAIGICCIIIGMAVENDDSINFTETIERPPYRLPHVKRKVYTR